MHQMAMSSTSSLKMTEHCAVTCSPDFNPKQSDFCSDNQKRMFQ